MLSINYRHLRNLQRLKGNLLLKGLPILGHLLSISYRLIINKLIINLLNELLLGYVHFTDVLLTSYR